MKRDPILDQLLADENLDPSFREAMNADYTPEEIAIEAQERAEEEAQTAGHQRAERAVELDHQRGIWRDGSGR